MLFKKREDVINVKKYLCQKKLLKKTISETKNESYRFRGSVRAALGRFFTDDKFDTRRKRVMSTPLP